MTNFLYPILWIVCTAALWMNSTTQRAYIDLINAGYWEDVSSRQSIKTFAVGASLGFLGCLFGGQSGFEAFGLIFGCGMLATTLRVITLAFVVHGLDSRMAKAMIEAYEEMKSVEAAVKADLGSERALQAYLDRTYGRGKVKAGEVIQQRKMREAIEATHVIH
jgi:hypothetical protein